MQELVIFTVDGVLVDDGALRARVWTDTLAAFDHRLDAATVARRIEGRDDRAVLASIERELGRPLGEAAVATFERRLGDAYRRDLRATADAVGTLRRLPRPVCAIAGASRASARAALESAGLWAPIAPHLFTTDQVANPPPAGELPQFAAAQMGAPVGRCVLVAASETTVRGGRAAGMAVMGFAGAGHVVPEVQARKLAAAGAHLTFDRLSELPPLLRARAVARAAA
jgi:beta-phosphoglucomutase-like phosphatase (HAD superfamily)